MSEVPMSEVSMSEVPVSEVPVSEVPVSEVPVSEVFGEYYDSFFQGNEYLSIVFSPSSVPLKEKWRSNNLSANFMADYFAIFSPSYQIDQDDARQAELKDAVSFIANELLENAMKYTAENASQPIMIQLQILSDRLVFLATNPISSDRAVSFKAFLKDLEQADPQELYMRQLEQEGVMSGVGYLTMMLDYSAKIGWKFDKVDSQPQITTVMTMVQLEI